MSGELKPPIILFGNFRSGTTLLQKLISTHPNVVPLYEPVGLWLYADPTRSHDEFDGNDATDKVKRYVRNEFLQFQLQNGNRIIAEKTRHTKEDRQASKIHPPYTTAPLFEALSKSTME